MSGKKLLLLALTCMVCARIPADSGLPEQPMLGQIIQPIQPPSDAKLCHGPDETTIKLNNAQDVDQKVIITRPKKDPTDCTQLHGKAFMECMECQSPENLKKNLMNCNDRMAHYYFLHVYSIEEYHEVLQNFTEKEWQLFYESRQPQARENFPKTLEEQRAMLKTLYIEAYFYNYLEYLWSGQSALKTDDLEKFIKDFNIRRTDSYFFNYLTPYKLHDRFYHFRKKLFTKPAH